MSKSPWLAAAMICSLVATPTISHAQATDATKDNPQDFVHDVLRGLLGPNWNLFLGGGVATGDRYLLQQALDPAAGQRSLQSKTGWEVSGGGGVDILLHTGLRATYTFASRELKYKTNNGNGSNNLDINNVGRLKSNTGALEIIHYMLPAEAQFNPYGTLGLQGTWWSLNNDSPLISSNGASTPFSISPLFSFGVQVRAASHWSGRIEAALAGGHNPFTGNKSFQSFAGPTVDEPSDVSRTNFRIVGVYHFSRPTLSQLTAMAKK